MFLLLSQKRVFNATLYVDCHFLPLYLVRRHLVFRFVILSIVYAHTKVIFKVFIQKFALKLFENIKLLSDFFSSFFFHNFFCPRFFEVFIQNINRNIFFAICVSFNI